jgi:hypothetical protein
MGGVVGNRYIYLHFLLASSYYLYCSIDALRLPRLRAMLHLSLRSILSAFISSHVLVVGVDVRRCLVQGLYARPRSISMLSVDMMRTGIPYYFVVLHSNGSASGFLRPSPRMFILVRCFLLFAHGVSRRTYSVHGCGSADLVRQAGNRCKPLDRRRLACQSCGRKYLALAVEAVAKSYPNSFFAAADVVLGSRNRPTTAGVRGCDHLAPCELLALLVAVVVISAVVVGPALRACGHNIEPSSLCRNFA